MKLGDIALGWVLDDFLYHLRILDSVVDYLRAPAVTVLYACEIKSVTFQHLTDIDAIVQHKGVVGVGSSTSRTSSTSHYSGLKAFATHAHKAHYTEDKHRAQ